MKLRKNLDLMIILGTITVIAIIVAVILIVRPYEIKKFDKITHLTTENYNKVNKNKEEYFVLLYDSKDDSYEMVEECVLAYVEFARTNKNAPKLYVIDYQENKTIINSSHFNISESKIDEQVPCLATISTSGSVGSKKTTISTICNTLEDYMSGKTHIHE